MQNYFTVYNIEYDPFVEAQTVETTVLFVKYCQWPSKCLICDENSENDAFEFVTEDEFYDPCV